MSYVVSLSQRNFIYSRPKEQVLSQNKSRKLIVYFLILLIVLFSVLYVVQTNNVATGGYKIQEYKNELSTLQSENNNLELKLSEVRSPGFLEQKVEALNMVRIEKVEYISLISEVAAR